MRLLLDALKALFQHAPEELASLVKQLDAAHEVDRLDELPARAGMRDDIYSPALYQETSTRPPASMQQLLARLGTALGGVTVEQLLELKWEQVRALHNWTR